MLSKVTSLLRVLANAAVLKGALSAEAAAAIHKVADEADGGITGKEARRLRLSPLAYCVACDEWVENPCWPAPTV